MSVKTKNILSLIFNCAVVILIAIAMIDLISTYGIGVSEIAVVNVFCYFTIETNIFTGLVCLLMIPRCIKKLRGEPLSPSRSLILMKLAAANAIMIVFLVVLFFLSFVYGFSSSFGGPNLLLHAVNPILTIVSFLFFDGEGTIERKDAIPACLPAFLYSIVYLTMVIFVKKWPDFYQLNIGGFWYISFIVMNAFNLLLLDLVRKLHNKLIKRV